MGGPIYHDVATKSYRDALGNTLATKMDRLNQNPNWQAIKDRVWTGETPSSVQYKWARVDVIDAPPEPLDRLKPGDTPGEYSFRGRARTMRILWGGGIREVIYEHVMRYGHRIPPEDCTFDDFLVVYYDSTKVDDPTPFVPADVAGPSTCVFVLHLTDIEYGEPVDSKYGPLDERRRPVRIFLKEAPVANRQFKVDKQASEVPALYYDDMSRVYRDAFGTQYATNEDRIADSTRWKTVKDHVRDTVPADVLSRWADDGGNNLEGSTLPSVRRPDPDKGPGVADKGQLAQASMQPTAYVQQPDGSLKLGREAAPERARVQGDFWYIQFERPEKGGTNWIGPFGASENARRWISCRPGPPLPHNLSVVQVPQGGFVVGPADKVYLPEQWTSASAPGTVADASPADLNRALERPFGNWFIFVGDAKPWGPFDYQWEANRTAGNWLGTGDYKVERVPPADAVVIKDISPEQKRDLLAVLSESRMVPLRETPGSAEWVRENLGHIERTILMPEVRRAMQEHTERALAQHVEAFHRTRDTAVQGLVNADIRAGGPTRQEGEVPGPKDHLRAWPSLEGDVDPRVFSSLMVTNPYRAWLLLNRFTPFGEALKALILRRSQARSNLAAVNAAIVEAVEVAVKAGVTEKTALMCQTRILNALESMPGMTLGQILQATATPVPAGSGGTGAPGWYFKLPDAPFPTCEFVGPFPTKDDAKNWLAQQPTLKIGSEVLCNYLVEAPKGIEAQPGDRVTPPSVYRGVQ
jgi:hypothetical protein